MGMGDNIMASGMARGAARRGKRIAFGDGEKIKWDQNSEIIFRGNPNVALPGFEKRRHTEKLEWVPFYRGNRLYNKQDGRRWVWNYEFSAKPGELFFSVHELRWAKHQGKRFVLIEPNVPAFKSVGPNKQWPFERYDEIARRLVGAGHQVVQFVYEKPYGPGHRIAGVDQVRAPTFRLALAVLARASLYVGPEGGLHHGAAALDVPGVVLFGGFIPPQVTGYAMHTNLTGGAEACGSIDPCGHCKAAMAAITVEEVHAAAMSYLQKVAA